MKTKRVWLVFAGCMLMYGAMMGILFNCSGVLINGVLQAEGFTSSSISHYYTLRSLVSTISMLFTAKLLTRYNIKLVTVSIGFVGMLAYVLMSTFTQPWQWAVSGVLHGLASSLVMLLPTSVIRVWFVKNRGTFLGVFMMLSGVFGAVLNPVVSRLIDSIGWRKTALVMGISSFILVCIAAVLIERRPSDVGALPYGGTEEDAAPSPSASGAPVRAPFRIGVYLYIFLTVTCAGMCIQMNSYLPQYASSLGYASIIGANMMSAVMIGNSSAKFLFGVCSDYLGLWRSVQLFMLLIGAGMVLLMTGSASPILLYIGSLLLGFGYMNGVANSLICVELFNPEHFEVQYSRVSMIGGLGASLVPAVVSRVYDSTGSFTPVFTALCIWVVISVLLISLRDRIGVTRRSSSDV